jgi:hypothetical protein
MSNRPVLAATGACGLVSAALFAAADISGAALRPSYSSVSQAISELIEAGAPHKALLDTMLTVYHGLVIPFALGLHKSISDGAGNKAGPILLASAGALGVVLTLFFPCDPGCEPFVSLRGTMHIFIAIPMGFAILFAILAFSFRLSRDLSWGPGYALYSRITFATGAVLAAVTVALAESNVVGVLERLLTASYLQWYVVMGIAVICRRAREAFPRERRRRVSGSVNRDAGS